MIEAMNWNKNEPRISSGLPVVVAFDSWQTTRSIENGTDLL